MNQTKIQPNFVTIENSYAIQLKGRVWFQYLLAGLEQEY